ncbi:uncharacterized protein haspin [Melanotaenia boesemani]|uniref:uncharacterized protein haspin n=1 Tax=Melanotaenia boesemani TaxID=1250792 RepID=UPI001C0475C6|nr:uncharacterized protein haspin [Melanotaenia boesemani]
MKPFKPVILKTYGRQMRKVSAWISPENRKRVFDSSTSTDDMSVFEPPKRKRGKSSVASGCRVSRLAKKKAMLYLTEKHSVIENMSDEENIIPSPSKPLPAAQSRATKAKKTSVCQFFHPAKRKAVLCLTTSSCNEDNIMKPSSPQRQKMTKKSLLVSEPVLKRMRGQGVAVPSESEEEETSALKDQKVSAKKKEDSNVHVPSSGRFVTRRRRAAPAKLHKAIASILHSSDEFTSGEFRSSRIHRPLRRRRVPPAFGLSSSQSLVNSTGISSFSTDPFQVMSFNESADDILGPCPSKPIFCSTPSAGPFSKQGQIKICPTHDEVTTPPSCIGVLNTFQENLVSLQQSKSACKLNSEERLQRTASVHHNEDLSFDLFTEPKRGSCSGDSENKNRKELPTTTVLSADDESSSNFVSTAGSLELLREALKEECLSHRSTVQLRRLDHTTLMQLCSQTTYLSCLEFSSSGNWKIIDPVDESQSVVFVLSSEKSFNHQISVANNKSDYSQASVADRADVSASADCKQSAKHFKIEAPAEESESDICDGSTHQTDQSCDVIMRAQLSVSSSEVTGFSEDEAKIIKGKKCRVQLQRLSSSQITAQYLKEGCVACHDKSVDQKSSQNEKKYVRCSGGSTKTVTTSLEESKTNKSPLAKTKSTDPDETAALTLILKEKCLTDKLIVQAKKKTLSQLKEVLKPKDASLKSSTDVSDSASDDVRMTGRLSESDCSENEASLKVGDSVSSESKISSGTEVEKNSQIAVPTRKNLSLAPKEKKRRSSFADRSGTTRKVCVSGISTSRWKNKGGDAFWNRTAQMGGAKAADCSISELMSKQPAELAGPTMNFLTPVRVNRLNMSSLLANLSPNTHTWSRLKAALSVHRKGMVQLTPRNLNLSAQTSPRRPKLIDLSRDLFSSPSRTPLSQNFKSQLLSQYSLSADVCEEPDLSDAEKVYAECGQQHPLPWEECIPHHRMKQCAKIGEGTFGEVFSTTKAAGEMVALKVIPVEGTEKVNGEDQKTFGEILHEIIISKELSSLKEKQQNQTQGFIGLIDLHCVQGCYPPDFLNAWDTFDQSKVSENDRPDFFKKDQLFIILEFEFGGVDLENSNGTLASLGVAKSILHQVTAALAVAEQELRFEHRDLHWGNVLVKTTTQKTGSFLLNGTVHSVATKGVLVRIIDYSISRLEIDDLTVSCDISNDEELFMGQGDYQFDMYRLMRQENGNNWSNYHPHTNVLWLHYLCSKLLSMKYRGKGGRICKNMREELTCFYDNVLQYSSATEALQNCPMFQ